jgi:hypothetical protein
LSVGRARAIPACGTIALPEIQLRVGGLHTTIRPAQVFAKPVGDGFHHGLLGMDVLSQAREVSIDFRSMMLELLPSGRGERDHCCNIAITLIDRVVSIRVGIPTGVVSVIAWLRQLRSLLLGKALESLQSNGFARKDKTTERAWTLAVLTIKCKHVGHERVFPLALGQYTYPLVLLLWSRTTDWKQTA